MMGRIGIAVTPMIPSGRVEFGEKFFDAISDDGKIERGEEVEVIAFSMGTLNVKRFHTSLDDDSGCPTGPFLKPQP